MKKIVFLMLLASQAYPFTVISERIWCSGTTKCNGNVRANDSLGTNGIETTRAGVFLQNMKGYQGLEIGLGATHTFFIYNGDPVPAYHVLRATLCDMNNNCFNYEKTLSVGYRESYSETVYSQLSLFRNTIGAEPISAESKIEYSPVDRVFKEAMLLIEPFPYD